MNQVTPGIGQNLLKGHGFRYFSFEEVLKAVIHAKYLSLT
jgi:hypothetical protein